MGTAFYEMRLGEYIPNVRKGYEYLYPEVLRYAEEGLSDIKDGKHKLTIFSSDSLSDGPLYQANSYKSSQAANRL